MSAIPTGMKIIDGNHYYGLESDLTVLKENGKVKFHEKRKRKEKKY